MANPAAISLRHSGVWKAPFQIWVKDNTAWKDPLGGWINYGGVWERFWPLVDPTLNLDLDFTQMETLDPRITFSRNGWGTYYDANGVLQYSANNLFTNSEDFSTGFFGAGTIVTLFAGTAPNGTNTANLCTTATATSMNWRHDCTDAPCNLMYSLYVKSNGNKQWVCFACYPGFAQNYVWFDIATETVANKGSSFLTAGVQDVGDGWKRCWAKASYANGGSNYVYICDGPGSTTFTPPGSIYLWGGQFEHVTTQALPGPYNKTVGSVVYGGPRLDHNPATREPIGLAIERSVSRYVNFTQHFDNTPYWTATNCTVSGTSAGNAAGNVLSPDGMMNGFTLTATGVAPSNIVQNGSPSVAQSAVASIHVKKGTATWMAMRCTNAGDPPGDPPYYAWFNLEDGTTGAIQGPIAETGVIEINNGWYRCWARRIVGGSFNFGFGPCDADGSLDVTAGKTIYAWGAQLEGGTSGTCFYPSSYYPSWIGSHPSAPEAVSMAGLNFSNWYNQTEGTFVVEFDVNAVTNASRYIIQASNSTAAEQINMLMLNLLARGQVYDNSVLQADSTAGNYLGQGVRHILGLSYKLNQVLVSLNGNTVTFDTLGTVPTPNRLTIGWEYSLNVINAFKGHIRRIRYYYVAKGAGELQLLTTLPDAKLKLNATDGADSYFGSDMWTTFAATDGADVFAGIGAYPIQQQTLSASSPYSGGSSIVTEDHTGKTRIV